MTEVAGAVADGLLVHPFSTERYFREVTLPALARGRARAGRGDAAPFEIVSAGIVGTGATEEELAAAIEQVRARLAFDASTAAYRPVLDLHGWGDLADELHRLSRTPDADKWDRMSDDDVVNAFAVIGEPETIGVKLRERWGDLVTRYEISDIGIENPEVGLRLLRDLKG
jgi:hypothetical protein